MKNKLFIFLLLFLLCGCSCEYNLKIDGDNYLEKLIITPTNDEEKNYVLKDDWIVDINYSKYNEIEEVIQKHEDRKYYDVFSNNSNLTLSYLHDYNTIRQSTIALKCFDKVTILTTDNNFYISTSNKFKCFDEYKELENVSVIIEVDGEVTANNADKIENKKYIWYFNKDNINKSINITMANNTRNSTNSSMISSSSYSSNKNQRSNEYYIFIFILTIILLIGYLVYRKLQKQSDNNNQI